MHFKLKRPGRAVLICLACLPFAVQRVTSGLAFRQFRRAEGRDESVRSSH